MFCCFGVLVPYVLFALERVLKGVCLFVCLLVCRGRKLRDFKFVYLISGIVSLLSLFLLCKAPF